MDDYGWRGQGGPSQPETGIEQVLAYYARYGGELLGARRSDNPLTLTHVRWHDQAGHVLDASHSPERDGDVDVAEREIWVQLALDLPIAAAGMFGAQAPWEHLALNQDRAAEMLNQLRRSLSSRTSGNSNNPAPWSGGAQAPQPPGYQAHQAHQAHPSSRPISPGPNAPNMGWNASQPAAPGALGGAYPQPYPQPAAPQPPTQPSYPMRGAPVPQGSGLPGGSAYAPHLGAEQPMGGPMGGPMTGPDGREWMNTMRAPQPHEPEVTVIPCIEVELPPVLTDPAAADQARDFTRDVARHFNRSARQLPQVRETRGWMRNGRMVLAARIAVAPGTRVPSPSEMDNAARLLGDALARNLLPYTRMTFAEPGEWTQGVALPD